MNQDRKNEQVFWPTTDGSTVNEDPKLQAERNAARRSAEAQIVISQLATEIKEQQSKKDSEITTGEPDQALNQPSINRSLTQPVASNGSVNDSITWSTNTQIRESLKKAA